jgi:hypothetical protein
MPAKKKAFWDTKNPKKKSSSMNNGPGSWSFGPALSTAESKVKAKKRRK